MPDFFVEKLNLRKSDKEIIEKIFFPAIEAIKEASLNSYFYTFHKSTLVCYIHYFFRIPPEIKESETSFALVDLKKFHIISKDYRVAYEILL